jgi:HEAT repeat protein
MTRLLLVFAGIAVALAGCYATTTPEPEIVVPRLIALLQDQNRDLRQTAALSLGKIAAAEAATSLILALRDPDPLVRQYSAWGLGNLSVLAPSDAVPALILLLEDPVPRVAEAAGRAIGEIGAGPEMIARLLTMLKSRSVQARAAAVTALGWLESPLAYDGLLQALEDNDADLRQGAVAALGELGDRRAGSAIAVRLGRDTAVGVRNEAAYRLGTLGDERSLPILRAAAVGDPSQSVRRWAQRAIEALSSPAGPESGT